MPHDHEPLTLWQFTDSHLTADPTAELMGVNVLDALHGVIAAARTDRPWPDLVIATGDLVHDESIEGYRLLADTLGALPAPVYCLPGNHDSPVRMRQVLLNGPVQCAETWLAGRWQVILLDSTEPGQVAGRLSASELVRLRDALQRHPEGNALVALHHPPVSIGSPWMDAMGLINADELFEVIDAFPQVRGVVWGHIHQEFDGERRGVRLLGTPSTCVQFAPRAGHCAIDAQPPGYRWIRLHGDGRVESAVRRVARTL